MTEALISGAISGLLVIIEFIGLLVAKWTIVRKPAEKAALEAMAEFSRKFNPADVPDDQDVTEYIMSNMETTSNLAKSKVRDQVLAGMVPGPGRAVPAGRAHSVVLRVEAAGARGSGRSTWTRGFGVAQHP